MRYSTHKNGARVCDMDLTDLARWDVDSASIWRASFIGASKYEAKVLLREGDRGIVAEAEKLASKLHGRINIGSAMPQRVKGLAGRVCVPAALAGSPRPMRRRKKVVVASPLRIFYDMGASQSVAAKDLRERAIATLAFAQVCSVVRPVEIFSISPGLIRGGHETLVRIRIGVTPLNWSRAAVALSPLAYRGVGFRQLYASHGLSYARVVKWSERFRRRDGKLLAAPLGAGEGDVITDRAFHNWAGPEAWFDDLCERVGLVVSK